MDSIDIPFSSIFEDPSAAPEIPKDERGMMGNLFIILWDGRDIVCVIYRDSEFVAAEEGKGRLEQRLRAARG
jgi:hypothetical protein